MTDNDEFWKQKLMAFLHDPPCKCFDIGQHELIAKTIRHAAGIDDNEYEAFAKVADRVASAADRFPFPERKCSSKFTGDEEYPFKHPMGGSRLSFERPLATAELAEEKFKDSTGVPTDIDNWHHKFFLYWRRWPEESAKHDKRLAYLPADTRIPDHTIWTHMSLCSALQSCTVGQEKLDAAFLIFQLGPVQEFISQAKSTRDLWAGSYILSWLTAHAIKAVTDEIGPDCVIFPSLRGQPIYDILHKNIYDTYTFPGKNGKTDTLWDRMYKLDKNGEPDLESGIRRLLIPSIPNRFCAVVPTEKAEETARKAENAIAGELQSIGATIWEFLEKENLVSSDSDMVDKQRWNKQLELFPQITWQIMPWDDKYELSENLKKLEDLACNIIPEEDRDSRNYPLNPGFYWSAYYEQTNKYLAGRRNLRDFRQFITDKHQTGSEKDPFTGKEEVIGKTKLSAIMNIKQNFAFEYLQKKIDFTEREFKNAIRYDSTRDVSCNNKKKNSHNKDNNRYIAILAMDGDEMGKWVSGEKLPPFIEQLSGKAINYFNSLEKFDDSIKRPMSPSYHLQFSEALSNFSLHIAENVVRSFNGQLIYAGGDDVLAMLPATYALECAEALRYCFRGDNNISRKTHRKLGLALIDNGFVTTDLGYPLIVPGLAADVSCGIAIGHDSYPLQALVKEAQKAEKRAKNIYDRGAFAVSIIKRGGESVYWGGKWDGTTLPLYNLYSKLRAYNVYDRDDGKENKEYLSSGFAYALHELLLPYQLEKHDKSDNPTTIDFKDVIWREFLHVLKQQQQYKIEDNDYEQIISNAEEYLNHLFKINKPEDFAKLFLVSAFINRDRGE